MISARIWTTTAWAGCALMIVPQRTFLPGKLKPFASTASFSTVYQSELALGLSALELQLTRREEVLCTLPQNSINSLSNLSIIDGGGVLCETKVLFMKARHWTCLSSLWRKDRHVQCQNESRWMKSSSKAVQQHVKYQMIDYQMHFTNMILMMFYIR